ncbi:MAG: aromatic ring-hydroxylating dioxygenase subunit alpha, partial [Gammaproteobacteria bacterium]|nr:aromatic ring-hydroxylating dioxygenase subunit alpha [Gammaproteobacteria bacterium]
GGLVAMEDRCCHRAAPLSKGRREADAIRCGYHGLLFAADGRCIEAPGVDAIPARACVRLYPVTVKNRWVFVWMGEPQRADLSLLPDNFSCDHPDWRHKPGYLHFDAPYLLICDNLLDFSHLSYVHAKTLGGSAAIALSKPKIERIDGPGMPGVRVSRYVPDIPPPPYYRKMRPFKADARIDRWFVYDFVLPGTLLMSSGGRPTGASEGDDHMTVRLHSCQTLTPETETSTHYFFEQAHPADQGDESLTEGIYQSLVTAFHEDREMIRAQHRTIQADPTRPMVPLPIDGALVQFRRLLRERLEAEQRATRAAADETAGAPTA